MKAAPVSVHTCLCCFIACIVYHPVSSSVTFCMCNLVVVVKKYESVEHGCLSKQLNPFASCVILAYTVSFLWKRTVISTKMGSIMGSQ